MGGHQYPPGLSTHNHEEDDHQLENKSEKPTITWLGKKWQGYEKSLLVEAIVYENDIS